MDNPDGDKVHEEKLSMGYINAARKRREEYYDSPDRVCVIVWGTTLHDLLKRAVRNRLIQNDAHASRLFGSEGPFGRFAVLHNVAHAIGMISDNVRNDLHCIREIRNAFAHNVAVPNSLGHVKRLSFESQQIRDQCTNLKCPERISDVKEVMTEAGRLTWERLGRKPPDLQIIGQRRPRQRFEWTCRCLTVMISALGNNSPHEYFTGIPTKPIMDLKSDWAISGSPIDYPSE